jgi:hypothetical protein
MSVVFREEAGGKLLILSLSGKLTTEDYNHFTPQLRRAVEVHGKVRMLVWMHHFHGWTLWALGQDLKYDLRHFFGIERLALVGEKQWEAGVAAFCKPITTVTVRYFDESQADEADRWIHEGIDQMASFVDAMSDQL